MRYVTTKYVRLISGTEEWLVKPGTEFTMESGGVAMFTEPQIAWTVLHPSEWAEVIEK